MSLSVWLCLTLSSVLLRLLLHLPSLSFSSFFCFVLLLSASSSPQSSQGRWVPLLLRSRRFRLSLWRLRLKPQKSPARDNRSEEHYTLVKTHTLPFPQRRCRVSGPRVKILVLWDYSWIKLGLPCSNLIKKSKWYLYLMMDITLWLKDIEKLGNDRLLVNSVLKCFGKDNQNTCTFLNFE